jgi:hypothetical protein
MTQCSPDLSAPIAALLAVARPELSGWCSNFGGVVPTCGPVTAKAEYRSGLDWIIPPLICINAKF